MRRAIAMALIVQSIYKFCSWKAMNLSFQEQKNRTFISCPVQILLQREYEKVVKNQRRSVHCKGTVKKITRFCRYLRYRLWYHKHFNRFGFSRPRASFRDKVHDKFKSKDTSLRYKNIEKHAYLGLQWKFWKIKKVEFDFKTQILVEIEGKQRKETFLMLTEFYTKEE
jgi:hypothetical protein